MGSEPPLLTFLLMVVSGWVHRQQLIVIEYLQAEKRLLKERLRGKRIRFTGYRLRRHFGPPPMHTSSIEG